MNFFDLLKYASIWAQVQMVLEAIRQTGESGEQLVRGVKYKGRTYDLVIKVKRTA